MHKVLLAVRVVQHGEVLGYCSHELALPFAPFKGLRFEQGSSCKLWETKTGKELDPAVERVVFDLDENMFVCLFTVSIPLEASFWYDHVETDSEVKSSVAHYFRHTLL
jgi:hypothetical protein